MNNELPSILKETTLHWNEQIKLWKATFNNVWSHNRGFPNSK